MPGGLIGDTKVCGNEFTRIRRAQAASGSTFAQRQILLLLAFDGLDNYLTHDQTINDQRHANHEWNHTRKPYARQQLRVARLLLRNRPHYEIEKNRDTNSNSPD